MKEFVEYIAKSLVDHPEAVDVTESSGPGRKVVNLRVAPEDMGKVIGKQGRIAQAIRTLLKVATARKGSNGNQSVLVIGSTGGGDEKEAFPETAAPAADEDGDNTVGTNASLGR